MKEKVKIILKEEEKSVFIEVFFDFDIYIIGKDMFMNEMLNVIYVKNVVVD